MIDTTDATRGALGEYRDCSVLALANAAGVSYGAAHEALRKAGRKPRGGAYWAQVKVALIALGCSYHEPLGRAWSCTGRSTGYHTKNFDHAGIWLLSTPRHFTALIEGQLTDYIATAKRARKITGAIQVIRP